MILYIFFCSKLYIHPGINPILLPERDTLNSNFMVTDFCVICFFFYWKLWDALGGWGMKQNTLCHGSKQHIPAVCLEGQTHFNPSLWVWPLGMTDRKLWTITFIWQLFYLYTPKTLVVDQDPTAGAAVHQNQKYTDIPLNQLIT